MKRFPGFRVLLAAGVLLSGAALCAQQPIGDVVAADSTIRGSVVLASGAPKLTSGSSVTAGSAIAVVRLERGGQVRICPGSTVTMVSAGGANNLMMSLSDGAMETRYSLPALADAIVTPDFRLLLAGPGQFDVSVSSNSKGDLCVQSRSDSASVLVNELLGDGVYQVRARDTVVFHGGKVSGAELGAAGCGCPAPAPAMLRAQAVPLPILPAPPVAFRAPLASLPFLPDLAPVLAMPSEPVTAGLGRVPELSTGDVLMPAPANITAPLPNLPQPPAEESLTAPPPPLKPSDVHVEVDAPFVFNGAAPAPPVTPVHIVLGSMTTPAFPALQVLPPPPPSQVAPRIEPAAAKPKKKKGFFGRIGSFFGSLFRRS